MLLGYLIGAILPIFFMKEIDAGKNPELFKQRVFWLLALQAALSIAQLMFNCFIHKEKPDVPPSPAAMLEEQDQHLEEMTTWQSVCSLLHNVDYMLLTLNFSLVLGLFNTLASVTGELLTLYGYSLTEIGTVLAISLIMGFLGSFFFGYLVDRTRAYRVLVIVMTSMAFIVMVLIKFILTDWHVKAFGFVAIGVAGFFMLALPVVSQEFGVELTHPVKPNHSTQGMHFFVQITSLVFTWIATKWLERAEKDKSYANQLLSMFIVVPAVAIIISLFIN